MALIPRRLSGNLPIALALALALVFVIAALPARSAANTAAVTMLEDPTRALSFEAAVASDAWRPREPQGALRHGDMWLRVPVARPADPASRHILVVDQGYPILAELVLVDAYGAVLTRARSGSSVPSAERDVVSNRVAFHLPLAPGAAATAYLRLRYAGLSFTSTSVVDAEAWLAERQIAHVGAGLYFGAALALFIHNLGLFLASRERSFVIYVAMVGCIAVTAAHLNGYVGMLLSDLPVSLSPLAP